MSYATEADATKIYGQGAVRNVAPLGDDREPIPEAVSEAFERATGEINSYLSARYTVPINAPPPHLVQICVDMGLYRLAQTGDRLTDELRKRYDDAIRWLKDVVNGRAGLGIDEEDDPTAPATPGATPIAAFGLSVRG